MIEIKDVSKSYNNKTMAVDNLNIVIPNGQITGFLGPNGAGKTTTIKMITGILKHDSGTIKINNFDISNSPIEAKRQFGFVPDNPDMFLRLKGYEYVNFMADIYSVPNDIRNQRILDLSQRFEIKDSLGDQLQSYSHGMRQKIVLIGALIHNPSVWILDEPMTGLDPKSSYVLKEMMKEHISEGKTVFFSTHILEVAEKVCSKIAIINKGKILFYGTIDEIRNHFKATDSLENMFLEMTDHE